jgi:hypothetical protein
MNLEIDWLSNLEFLGKEEESGVREWCVDEKEDDEAVDLEICEVVKLMLLLNYLEEQGQVLVIPLQRVLIGKVEKIVVN